MTKKSQGKVRLHFRIKPIQQIVLGFVVVILLGTFALCLPMSSSTGGWTPFLTSLFTSVSATCVTGLTVVNTLTHWSMFGQIVILLMIQFGGLGTMSMIVILAMLLKGSVSPQENTIVAQSLGLEGTENLASDLMKVILTGTFTVEAIGALLLSVRFIPKFGIGQGIYKSIFHSVSAFCNAGFDILGPDGMGVFRDDPAVLFILSALIIIGGIGFLVWADVFDFIFAKRKSKLSAAKAMHSIAGRSDRLFAYTKFVLIVTAVLLVSGTALTLAFEWDNALAGMNPFLKISNAFFHSASLRTAGFASVDNGSFTAATKVFSIIFMFIGGASGSTAGGVKVSTVALTAITVVRTMLGSDETDVFRRRVRPDIVSRAMVLVLLGQAIVAAGTCLICLTGGTHLIDSLYEVTSAYATVGLSLGLTPALGTAGRIILIVLMFMGRVGVITIILSFIQKNAGKNRSARRPDTQFLIG